MDCCESLTIESWESNIEGIVVCDDIRAMALTVVVTLVVNTLAL